MSHKTHIFLHLWLHGHHRAPQKCKILRFMREAVEVYHGVFVKSLSVAATSIMAKLDSSR